MTVSGVTVMTGAGCQSGASARSHVQGLLARPLIFGASVSAGYGTPSPGMFLARREVAGADVRTLARGGAPGRAMIQSLTDRVLRDRTLLVTVDFLFWDSTNADSSPGLAALTELLERTREHSVPVVIGDIPELLPPGRQPSRIELNARIHALCAAQSHCRVIELDALNEQVRRDGYLEVRGHRYRHEELIPDGLHLSAPASEYIANRLLTLLREG